MGLYPRRGQLRAVHSQEQVSSTATHRLEQTAPNDGESNAATRCHRRADSRRRRGEGAQSARPLWNAAPRPPGVACCVRAHPRHIQTCRRIQLARLARAVCSDSQRTPLGPSHGVDRARTAPGPPPAVLRGPARVQACERAAYRRGLQRQHGHDQEADRGRCRSQPPERANQYAPDVGRDPQELTPGSQTTTAIRRWCGPRTTTVSKPPDSFGTGSPRPARVDAPARAGREPHEAPFRTQPVPRSR